VRPNQSLFSNQRVTQRTQEVCPHVLRIHQAVTRARGHGLVHPVPCLVRNPGPGPGHAQALVLVLVRIHTQDQDQGLGHVHGVLDEGAVTRVPGLGLGRDQGAGPIRVVCRQCGDGPGVLAVGVVVPVLGQEGQGGQGSGPGLRRRHLAGRSITGSIIDMNFLLG